MTLNEKLKSMFIVNRMYVINFSKLLWHFSARHCGYYGRPMEKGTPLYFCPVVSSFFLSSFVFYSPNLSRRRVDVYHTCTHHVALARI